MDGLTSAEHRTLRELLADHATGRLSAAERDVVERHLQGCDQCRAEADELERLIGTMRSLDPATVDAVPVPPDDLGDRVLARVRQASPAGAGALPSADRRSTRTEPLLSIPEILGRRSVRALLAAAAVVALLAVGATIGARMAQPAGPPFETIAFREPPTGVQAGGKLIAHTWGTEVNLVITGLEAGRIYDVTFVAADGREIRGGTFIGVSGRPILCNLNAAVLRPEVTELRITSGPGDPVLEADLSPS